MKFRLCRQTDYELLKRLWIQCFGDEEPWTTWFFSQHYQPENTWVGDLDGMVKAQTHLLPHWLMLRGQRRLAAFLVGVCVDETWRGGGVGRALLSTALAELRRRGTIFNILQPRYPEFYQKLGWSFAYDRRAYHMPLKVAALLLPEITPQLDFCDNDTEPLAVLYEKFTRLRHGFALRNRRDWDILLQDHRGEGGRIATIRSGGEPCGYALYNITRAQLYIRELIWLTTPVLDAALKQLAILGQNAGVETLEWLDPSGESASVLSGAAEPEPFLMARINDLQAWAQLVDYPADCKTKLEIQVTDPIAAWNNGRFCWVIRNGRGNMQLSSSTAKPDLELGIDVLTQWYFGYAGVKPSGKETGGNSEAADWVKQLFPPCRNFISEYF